MLAYFKYSGLLVRTTESALIALGLEESARASRWFEVILPAGISFYTFQTLSYIIDVWRGQAPAERNFVRFAGFVSFFPHLVAGPLTRHHQLIPQLARIAATGITARWREGLLLFAVGLCKKVLIADRLGNLIDPLLAPPLALDAPRAWLALLGYAFQIYFDFSGYSDMAIGLGRLFGIELPQNFNSPYKATSPSDFWRRWHMTLSAWLRDYLYITLGGNRCSPARRRFNLMITMVLGGLWHGANWTFAAWGTWHGVLLVLHHALPAWERMSVFWQRNVTFLLVTLGWVFFRAESFPHAAQWFAGLAGAHGVASPWTQETAALAGLVILVPGHRAPLAQQPRAAPGAPRRGAAGGPGRRHRDGAAPHELRVQVPLLPVLTMRPFALTLALVLGLAVAVNGLAAWDRGRQEARLRAASAGFRPARPCWAIEMWTSAASSARGSNRCRRRGWSPSGRVG